MTSSTSVSGLPSLRLRFPATGGYLRVCRLNASVLAAELDFDLDELDDLKLAVDEAVTWLTGDDECGGSVELDIRHGDGRIEIVGTRTADDLPPRDAEDLVDAILGATVDSHELLGPPGAPRTVRLRKATASAP